MLVKMHNENLEEVVTPSGAGATTGTPSEVTCGDSKKDDVKKDSG